MTSSAKSRLYYFKFYAADFLTNEEIDCMPLSHRGILVTLWAMHFRAGKSLRDDPEYYARRMGADPSDVLEVLKAFFKKTRHGWHSPFMLKEIKAAETRRSKGKQGAAERWDDPGDPDSDSWNRPVSVLGSGVWPFSAEDGSADEPGDSGGKTCLEHCPEQCHTEHSRAEHSTSRAPTPSEQRPPSVADHSESDDDDGFTVSLLGPDRRTSSYASTSEPVHAGELLRGAFGGRAV